MYFPKSTCGFPGGTKPRFDSWFGKTSQRRKWQPLFLLGKFQGQRNLVGYSAWGRKDLDTTERLNDNNKKYLVYKKLKNLKYFICINNKFLVFLYL